jgi:hypothetical protein
MSHQIAFADICLAATNGTGTTGYALINQGTTAMAWANPLPTIGAGLVLSNGSAFTAAPTAITISAILDNGIAAVQGDIIYRSASGWVALAPSTAGQVLQTGGASANPSWVQRAFATSSATSRSPRRPMATGCATTPAPSKWINGREPYIVDRYHIGTMTASQVIFVHRFPIAVSFPTSSGTATSGGVSTISSLINATASATLNFQKCVSANDPTVGGNWTNVANIVFSAGGHSGAFTATANSFAQGDYIRVTGPSSADATLGNIVITLGGDR